MVQDILLKISQHLRHELNLVCFCMSPADPVFPREVLFDLSVRPRRSDGVHH